MKKEIVIKQNQKNQFTLVIMGIAMVLLSLFIIINPKLGMIYKLVGIIGVIFFGTCLSFIIIRFVKPIDLLIVNERGIEDNTTLSSIGFISWSDIEKVYIKKYKFLFYKEEFISIDIKNLDDKLLKLSMLKRLLIRLNLIFGFAGVSITLNSTGYSIDDVFNFIKMYYEEE